MIFTLFQNLWKKKQEKLHATFYKVLIISKQKPACGKNLGY